MQVEYPICIDHGKQEYVWYSYFLSWVSVTTPAGDQDKTESIQEGSENCTVAHLNTVPINSYMEINTQFAQSD